MIPAETTRARPWVVRLIPPDAGQPLARARVVDVATATDVSMRFPARLAARLYRSKQSGQPIRVALFALTDAGRHEWTGTSLRTEAAWVQVT